MICNFFTARIQFKYNYCANRICILAYLRLLSNSSACVPRAATRPFSSMTIWSIQCRSVNRWVIRSSVRPFVLRFNSCINCCSVILSNPSVGSSSTHIGALLPFVARTDVQRRVMINAIGPTWEGNQVWLITAAGALFASWPLVFAAGPSSHR